MIIILNEVLDYCIQYRFTYQKDTAEMMTETSSHPGQNLFQCLPLQIKTSAQVLPTDRHSD